MFAAEGERQTKWSQGQILPPEAALALQLVGSEEATSRIPLTEHLGAAAPILEARAKEALTIASGGLVRPATPRFSLVNH